MKSLRILKTAAAVIAVIVFAMAAVTAEAFADTPGKADKFGTVELYSTSAAGKVIRDSYGYSEQWFTADPSQENIGLALLSMQLIAASVENDTDGLGGVFLRKLDFGDVGFRVNKNVDVLDCNYTYASRTQSDGTKLVVVAIQSYAFDKEGKIKGWPQNFTVNGGTAEGEHYALSKAAEAVLPEIVDLAGEGDVRYWITGQSRGGAIANLIAARLPAELENRNKGIYAYTFEAPAVIEPSDDADREAIRNNYGYIHNYFCSDDLVTLVPPWGMIRYGVDHQLDTDEANAALPDELEKLGSYEELPDGYNREEAQKKVDDIRDALMSRVPTRGKYSVDYSETVRLADGTDKVIEYNYQVFLGKLLASIFGGALEDLELGKAMDYLSEAQNILEKYIRGYLAELDRLDGDPDPELLYWEAAQGLNSFLKEKLDVDLDLTDEEAYGLLKLAAPAIIDIESPEDAGYDPNSDEYMPVLQYLSPAMKLSSVIFSHHFDSLLARLHALAPAPEIGDLGFVVDDPEVSDPTTKMPRQIKAAAEMLDSASWLTASAQWNTDDGILKNNKHYYLIITLTAAGHNAPDDQKITINGREPIDTETSYKDGAAVITAVWKYTFGTPKMYTLMFDTGERGEAPEDMQVEAGTMLKYSEKPADPVCDGYRFNGWTELEGKTWDDVIVTSNNYFNAGWIRQIDKVKISFKVPRVGEKWKDPTSATRSPYWLDEIRLYHREYNEIEVIKKREKHTLHFAIHLRGSDYEFLTEKDEWGSECYKGVVLINGKEADSVSCEEGILQVDYTFKALPKMPKLSKKSITVKKGRTKAVKIIGKDKSIKNVYRNTKKAKIKSKKTAAKIKVKGLKKGKTTLKIKANGVWLKLKVKVK